MGRKREGREFMSTGMTMANDGSEPNPGTNHRQTYDSFMSITKWAVIAIAMLLIVLAIFLVR